MTYLTDEEFFERYGNKLNDEQKMTVKAVEGPVLLLAVPGSGKTTVLVNRLGYMLFVSGIAPDNILTLTYTVAATKDMKNRFVDIFGNEGATNLEFRTINGICAKIISHYGRLIGKKSFDLLTDDKVSGKILTDIYLDVMQEYPTESDIKNIRTLITYCKNMLLTEKEITEIGKDQGIELFKIYEAYNSELKNRSLMDYDDQMIYAYRMLKGSKELLDHYRDQYRYICVDEAQDTSKIQHMIISLLAGRNGNLFMVGDEDQSIYGFRAAYPDALLNFEKDHPGARVLVMDKNYRSNARIVELADKFIQKNFNRHDKHMNATREAGESIRFNVLRSRESQYDHLHKMATTVKEQTAVLYRDNESVLPLVDILERDEVSYRIRSTDMSFFSHRVVVDVTNILSFALSPMDPDLFMKVFYKFQTYLSKTDAEKMCYIADYKHIGILDAVEEFEINKRILGNVRDLRINLRNMALENPVKAISRIEKMGYGDYLKNNNIDDNKLFILKMLAKNETTIAAFLDRLVQLRNILANKEEDFTSKFILSTIHSSKGLEYENVVLMDVVNGVFPSKIIKSFKTATVQEKRDYEEERRIFYVGMTRAKDTLTILKYSDKPSIFVGELCKKEDMPPAKSKVKAKPGAISSYKKKSQAKTSSENVPETLKLGDKVNQSKYGEGVITDVTLDDDEIPTKFVVRFNDGTEKIFMFPFAFITGMTIIKQR